MKNRSTLGRAYTPFITALLVLLTAGPGASAAAQEPATLALVDGERPSGDLMDLDVKGFVLRVNGENQYFREKDVAAVEFVTGDASPQAAAALNRGQSVVVLRNGRVIEGRLSDINGGRRPLALTVQTLDGPRELDSSQVAQVLLRMKEQTGIPQTSASEKPLPGSIAVAANKAWTATNVFVKRGERVRFVGMGNIMVSPTGSAGVAGAEIKAFGELPVQTLPPGALIGRVADNPPFAIGSNQDGITMTETGPLQLGINDEYFDDNSGTFYVRVIRVPR